jgi:hypothetical protein
MVFNATFNNMSVVLVEETGVSGTGLSYGETLSYVRFKRPSLYLLFFLMWRWYIYMYMYFSHVAMVYNGVKHRNHHPIYMYFY